MEGRTHPSHGKLCLHISVGCTVNHVSASADGLGLSKRNSQITELALHGRDLQDQRQETTHQN